jgi:hypothetical protein
VSASIGALPLGNMEVHNFLRAFERKKILFRAIFVQVLKDM